MPPPPSRPVPGQPTSANQVPGSRRLLSGLRELMAAGAGGPAVLHDLVTLVADEMVAEVCSVYTLRPGDLLELTATCGLNPGAVGRTRLRVGEGIVGVVAATGQPQNLPDAQNHPAFAYRAETGELPFTSLLAVPVRRAGRVLGVLAVQNRASRRYADDELDVLQTVAMLLAEMLGAGGAVTGAEDGIGAAVPRLFQATALAPGVRIFIGEETGLAPLDGVSLVTAPYGADGQVLGVLGVIGPTRMAYDRVIPVVQAAADALGDALRPVDRGH